ncbi:Terminase, ATPase subunit [Escherichia coli]|nr:Terminase, ATPase subunit [Escherichia coli]
MARMDFRAQADAIKKLTEQYNVTYIGIDSTGVGHGVYENVKAFFPAVREFVYNPNVKNALVLKPTTLSATAVWSLTPDTPT